MYEGNFENGIISGTGKCVWQLGKEYEGEWENNKMNGKGIFLWQDGKKYIGFNKIYF